MKIIPVSEYQCTRQKEKSSGTSIKPKNPEPKTKNQFHRKVKMSTIPETVRFDGGIDGNLFMIDQTLLPLKFVEISCPKVEDVWEAIKKLRVRGAPAIGIAAGFGVVVGIQPVLDSTPDDFDQRLRWVLDYLASSRPTAVNLFWALDRMKRVWKNCRSQTTAISNRELAKRLLEEAFAIQADDRKICRAIGNYGAELIQDGWGLHTHCNAGGLATADYGTALGVFFACAEQGKKIHVYADETRPLLQGARLTTWELMQRGIPVTLICDSMAAQVMREGKVQAAVVGADRIAANGDTANKIGTYQLAIVAKEHGVPFYVAAPKSTFDLTLQSGAGIPIEQRDPKEIICGFGKQTAPTDCCVYNPAFDVTPAKYITGIITEFGVISPVNEQNVRKILQEE